MFWFISYIVFGLVLAGFTTINGTDRYAITHLGFVITFVLAWPILVIYMAYMIYTRGVIRFKGNVIWRANKG